MTTTLTRSALSGRERAAVLRTCVVPQRASGPDGAADPVDPSVLRSLQRADPDGLVAVLRFHRVVGLAHLRLRREPTVPPELLAALSRQYDAQLAHKVRVLASLATVAGALDGAEVPWLGLKGPVLAAAAYERPDARTYGDLDVLVDRRHLRPALEALEGHGFVLSGADWASAGAHLPGEVQLVGPLGIVLDLHWHVVYHRRVRAAFAVDVQDMLDHRRSVPVGGRDVPALDPVHTLLHTAIHAALSGGHRLCWLVDVDRAARRCADWTAVLRVARRWEVDRLLGTVLRRARRLVGTPVPAPALAALPRGPWELLTAAVDTASPVDRLTEDRSLAKHVARAARPTSRRSVQELGRRLWVRGGGTPPRPAPAEHELGGHPADGHPPGGEDARARYLRRVAGTGPTGV